jgi:hypothetical protein
MFDDEDDHDDGGLSGPVWFQFGRWAEQEAQQTSRILDNLSRSFFSYQPAQTIVDTHELNALIAERDSLHQQVRALRQQVHQQATQITQEQDYALAVFEDKDNHIEELETDVERYQKYLETERRRHNVTAEVKQFVTWRCYDIIKYVEHGLAHEPEFRELTQLTKEFYRGYSPANDSLRSNPELHRRVQVLTDALDQKCKK